MNSKWIDIKVAILWQICRLVSALPRVVRYNALVPFVAFILRRVVRYRRKLILRQLRDSFPTYSDKEIERLCNLNYNYLAEMIIGTLSLAGATDEKRRKDTEFNLPEGFLDSIQGRNIVVLTSHFGFWEIALNLYLETPKHIIAVAYHPLKSPTMNELYKRLRKGHSVAAVASHSFMRYYLTNRNGVDGRNLVVGLISDQNCAPTKGCCWHHFLNHDTLFFDGGEQLALKFGLPVYYLELERIGAGKYRHNYTQIYDGVEQVAPHDITERYVRCLERTIVAKPEHWMWSHNRWKFAPDANADQRFYNNYREW